MGTVSTGHVVSAALDPVLVPAGYAGGQYGEGGEDPRPPRLTSITIQTPGYCEWSPAAAGHVYARAFPVD